VNNFDPNKLRQYSLGLREIESSAINSSRALRLNQQDAISLGDTLFRSAKKFAQWMVIGTAFMQTIRAIRFGIQTVSDLDKSLTELNKVANLTNLELKTITKESYRVGTSIGRTGKEVIDATASFKRAGFEISEAFELSKQALLLTNIGDGMEDVKESSSSLISILKGFKLEAKEAGKVVDSLNEVSNNFAVDTNNLTEIMKRVSGTIAQTGASYQELLGLATGGFETLRNAEMVASGINMISQRLRGMSQEGENVEDLIPKIQKAFDKYTQGAVSIIDKQNGGLHSTYEILQQLNKVYPSLTDEAKAYLNEAIAGNVALYVQKCA
jgi:TP901 family phage tail tape measure protein